MRAGRFFRSSLFQESSKSLLRRPFSGARVGLSTGGTTTALLRIHSASLVQNSPVFQTQQHYGIFSGPIVRLHSTSSTESDQQRMQKISRLLNEVPIGSMSPEDWKDAKELLYGPTIVMSSESITTWRWKLLDRLVEESKVGKTQVDKAFLNKVVGAWRSNPDLHPTDVLKKLDSYAPHLLPDIRSYRMIVDMAMKAGRLNPSERPRFVESVLEHMNQESELNPKVMPDVVIYGMLLDAWAKSGDQHGPQKAESVLLRMQELHESGNADVKPNTISFNTVISAWASSGDRGAAQRAEAILERMQELYESGNADVKPDTISFNTVISAWTNSRDRGAAQRTEAILGECKNCTNLVMQM